MTWWFWAAALRHNELHEAYLLCKEARASAFPDLARMYIDQSCDLAQKTVGPAALRTALEALANDKVGSREPGDRETNKLIEDVSNTEACLEMIERIGRDRIGAVADWSMTGLAQVMEAFETGADWEPKAPSPEDIINESNKIADFIVAIGWERNK